jgi:hypothetical protein
MLANGVDAMRKDVAPKAYCVPGAGLVGCRAFAKHVWPKSKPEP